MTLPPSLDEGVVTAWVEELLQQSARWNIVFVQLGAAYPYTRLAIPAQVEDVVSVVDYVSETGVKGSLRLVTDVERLLESGAPTLGQLRERVHADRDAGARVILMSRRPKIAFPVVPGSQILWDAKQVAPPSYREADAATFGNEVTCDGVPIEVAIASALRELGEVSWAEIDVAIFEDARGSIDLTSIDESVLEALISSGLLLRDDQGLTWAFPDAVAMVRSALADVIAATKDASIGFGALASNVWVIERLVKRALRARAKAIWGDAWRGELLGRELGERAFARAVGATYATAETLDDLRDPLEWITLAETIVIREMDVIGDLGVSEPMWALMKSEILPVKDRLDRSHLIRRGDVGVAEKWIALLSQRLSISGSRSHADLLKVAPLPQRDLLREIGDEVAKNPAAIGDVYRDFMSLAHATVKFVAHVADVRPSFTRQFAKDDVPLERELQDAFKAYLDMSDLAGRSAVEVSALAGGRADVVLYLNDGSRYVTEVKRELDNSARQALEVSYLPQTTSYQMANVPLGQLLVLDLTPARSASAELLQGSVWVSHQRNDDGVVVSTALVAVVRGNRPTPSERRR